VSPAPAGDSPYLHHADYWVASGEAGEYPIRQGDLFANLQTADGGHFDANQHQRVVAGISEKDGGVRIAFAHTFFIAPVEGSALDFPMWADFRELALAPRDQFSQDARVGALTHDARVTFIRRYLCFRPRWPLSFEQVREMEAARIAADPAFAGPRPDWVG
jgi:hypothetical protein